MKKFLPKTSKTKKILASSASACVFAAILVVAVIGHAAGATTMSISPSTQTVTQGNNVTFTVSVNTNGDSVNAVQTTVGFDSSKFSFVSTTAGDFSTGFSHSETSNSTNFAGGSITPVNGSAIAATIVLHAIAGGNNSPITLSSICTGTADSTCSTVVDSVTPSQNDLVTTNDGSIDVTPLPPSNTVLPVISGTTTEGNTLSTTNGTWTNSPTSYTYQWRDCDSGGANCSDIVSATNSTYVLASGDVGHTIRVVVTATNSGGSGNATSAASAVIAPAAPSNSVLPVISGTTTQGNTLSTTNGTWTNSPTSYTYQWRDCDSGGANCSNVASGGTSSTYGLASGDVGHTIRVVVTATNSGGSGNATSAATAVIAPAAPSNSVLPVISGTTTQGNTLSTTNGTWTNSPTSYTYQWKDCDSSGANCSNVASGGTSSTYQLAGGDVGSTIKVVVTATNSGGSGNATSAATAVIGAPVCTIPSTPGTPTLSSNAYTTISFNWTASTANAPCTLSGYHIYRALVTGGNPGAYAQVGNPSSASFTDSGLTAGNDYSYYVVAYDSSNDISDNSATATLSTAADNEPPSAPTNLKLTLDGPSQVDSSWTASTENPNLGGVSINNYTVSRATVTGGVTGSYSQVGTSNGAATSFQDQTVSNNPSTTYSYEVTGVDDFNNSPASAAAVTQTLSCTTSGGVTTCTLPNGTNLNTTNVIVVANEVLVNDGTLCNGTVQNSGILKGGGTLCDLVVNSGGVVSPGHSPGCVTLTGNLVENGTYTVEIQSPGNTACTDYDQLVVGGTVTLGGTLDPELLSGFVPAVGQSFEIINNQGGSPVSGTFNGLSEGAVFALGSNRIQISYRGGAGGNSVVLTVVNPNTPVTASLTAPNTGFKLAFANAGLVLVVTALASTNLLLAARKFGTATTTSSKE